MHVPMHACAITCIKQQRLRQYEKLVQGLIERGEFLHNHCNNVSKGFIFNVSSLVFLLVYLLLIYFFLIVPFVIIIFMYYVYIILNSFKFTVFLLIV